MDGVCITDGKAKMTDIRRRVGLVFQYPEYQLFEETVAKDVAFGPRNLGMPEDEIEKRVRAALSIVGLDYDDIGDSSPFDLSGGQKRRVAIAGVIAMQPSTLILDEPTAGLDPSAHHEILSMIDVIRENTGMTVIFVSHNMGDIAMMADRVMVMNKGKIALDGTPAEVFAQDELLAEMGLGIPPAREMVKLISSKAPDFESRALTIDDAAADIKKYLQARSVSSDEEQEPQSISEGAGDSSSTEGGRA